jgi:hypothetical protein
MKQFGMATEFDPLKAAREELAGIMEVQRVIAHKERRAEEALSLAESEVNAIRKINGYLRISIDAMRQRIAKLEDEQEGVR